MHHELQSFADPDLLAKGAASFIARLASETVARTGQFTFAASGGTTPWAMLSELALLDIPWQAIRIFQVDERIVPLDNPMRNVGNINRCLANVRANINGMPVDAVDLEQATRDYGNALPSRIDLVHLGLGVDGHTASLIPGDRALDVTDRLIAITDEYQGSRRMTFTYPAIASADQILWLVAGREKQWSLARLLDGDTSIPAGRVEAPLSLVMAEQTAL